MQTRKGSFAESLFGTAVGFVISMIAYEIIFPIYHIETTTSQNMQIVIIMTFLSIARQYVLRRVFNNFTVKRMLENE